MYNKVFYIANSYAPVFFFIFFCKYEIGKSINSYNVYKVYMVNL